MCIVLFAKWRKGRPKSSQSIPDAVSLAVETLLCRARSDNQEVTAPCVTETLQWAIQVYDSEADYVNKLGAEHNERIMTETALLGSNANWEEAAARAWQVIPPSNCIKTGGRLLISTLHATANSISGIHRKTELSFFEWSWEETLTVTGETMGYLLIAPWVAIVIVKMTKPNQKKTDKTHQVENCQVCGAYMLRILLGGSYVKDPLVSFIC